MNTITCKEAKQQNLSYYFTGRPCKYGHISQRKVSNNSCRQCNVEQISKWKTDNPERVKVSNKIYRNVHKTEAQTYREQHRTEANKYAQQYRRDNPEYCRAMNAERYARKLQAKPDWVDSKELLGVYLSCPEGMQVDHIIPLKAIGISGLHVPWNLQYLTPSENRQKKNSFAPYYQTNDNVIILIGRP